MNENGKSHFWPQWWKRGKNGASNNEKQSKALRIKFEGSNKREKEGKEEEKRPLKAIELHLHLVWA